MSRRKDLTGQVFGQWTVIRFDQVKNKASFFICKCFCGKEKSVRSGSLINGDSKSCGCTALGKMNDARVIADKKQRDEFKNTWNCKICGKHKGHFSHAKCSRILQQQRHAGQI